MDKRRGVFTREDLDRERETGIKLRVSLDGDHRDRDRGRRVLASSRRSGNDDSRRNTLDSSRHLRPINHSETCPFLLRMFLNDDKHHDPSEFIDEAKLPGNEVWIHTWKDCTLRTLRDFIFHTKPEIREKGSFTLSFAFVYIDPQTGSPKLREAGSIHSYLTKPDEEKTLKDLGFVIGDYVSVALIPQPVASTTNAHNE